MYLTLCSGNIQKPSRKTTCCSRQSATCRAYRSCMDRRPPQFRCAALRDHVAPLQALGAEGAVVVGLEKERRHHGSPLRVKPGAPPERWPRASTRPRWPVDAKAPFKNCECFSQPADTPARQGGQGFRSQARPARRGWKPPVRQSRPLNAANMASARCHSKPRNPLNTAVQAGFRCTASRRAEPLPSLSLAQSPPAAKRHALHARDDSPSTPSRVNPSHAPVTPRLSTSSGEKPVDNG